MKLSEKNLKKAWEVVSKKLEGIDEEDDEEEE